MPNDIAWCMRSEFQESIGAVSGRHILWRYTYVVYSWPRFCLWTWYLSHSYFIIDTDSFISSHLYMSQSFMSQTAKRNWLKYMSLLLGTNFGIPAFSNGLFCPTIITGFQWHSTALQWIILVLICLYLFYYISIILFVIVTYLR